jgi:hypothetical protein
MGRKHATLSNVGAGKEKSSAACYANVEGLVPIRIRKNMEQHE